MKIKSKISATGAGHDDETTPKAMMSPLNGAASYGSTSSLTGEFYNVLADIEYLVKDVAQLTGDDLSRTTQKINEHIATARKTLEAMSETLTERAHKTIADTNDYVQRQPLKAIGISAAVGLVLGALLARRA